MTDAALTSTQIEKEARRILRRLAETGAVLVISPSFEKAVVMRDTGAGRPVRTAVTERSVAEAFALNDWIALQAKGRVHRYKITEPGRAALRRFLASDGRAKAARRDESVRLQHMVEGEKVFVEPDGRETTRAINIAESPLGMLARRKSADGSPFLNSSEIEAGERLREDFERAQLGPSITQNWDRFLSAGRAEGFAPWGAGDGSQAARDRVSGALTALGPGLADITLRCCCFLEGVEGAEKRLGWSARSGKVVLKIALGRLARHYGFSAEASAPSASA
ncbi:MAG: DUF6456 domain-containing protein [Pseudomonadota bacterium]